MRAADVVAQLAVLLPQKSALFTTNTDVLSVTRSGAIVTVQCANDHGLDVGKAVALAGAITQMTISTLTRSGVEGTLVTAADQDLTNRTSPTITISGATEAEFNGTFTLVNVDNRQTIRFTMADSGAVTATGSPVLEDGESALRQYNGTYQVETVPSPSSFTVTQPDTTLLDPIGTITARGKPRISSGVNAIRMVQGYTEQKNRDYWIFVGLEDVNSSKSRSIRSDAQDNLTAGDNFRQQVIQAFTIYVFIPAQDDLSHADARDEAEDLFQPLCQSVLASKFDSGLQVSELGAVMFVRHGTFATDTAVYVHAYEFQQVVDLYEGDTVGPDLDVAFRNLSFSSDPDIPGSSNTTALTAALDLDDVPL